MGKRIYADHFARSNVNEQFMRDIGWTLISAPDSNVGENVKQIVAWIEANCSGNFIMLRWTSDKPGSKKLVCQMAFEDHRDAMNVKLRWS